MREITAMGLDYELGVLDWRHTMKTMFVSLAHCDFNDPDEVDQENQEIYKMFAHSHKTAQGTYGLQLTDAVSAISHTSVASHQRVGARWQAVLKMLHPKILNKFADSKVRYPASVQNIHPN